MAQTSTSKQLTAAQRKTLNAAESILVDLLTNEQETLMFSLHGSWERISVTFFDAEKMQHGSIWPLGEEKGLAAKIERVIELQASCESNADAAKARRIERLRKELADLGEAA
ncbi:hypothetical protein [Sphingobium sp. BS19]|uniref:hypothetical protein n=1 Tax=Sphingobium sp. BS19 TaxID=3018973 RepID=UPI0022ED8879|nr:hypothetical protein [Sphingobium sp. BS19]GLI99158.1 hypothetical protein Sbs19_29760 [Sphingobium sp. BS19]